MTNQEIDINRIEGKLNTHLDVYRENGKESKRVADALNVLIQHSMDRDKKVDEMYLQYINEKVVDEADIKRVKSVIMWGSLVAAFTVIGGSIRWILR